MSEEKKAVDEEIRWEMIKLALHEAFEGTCKRPGVCGSWMLPTLCFACGWDSDREQAKIEQVLDESS